MTGTDDLTPEAAPENPDPSLYVEQVVIRNLRGITDLTIDLEPELTVLVGRSNSGKSRVLRALVLGLGGLPADLDDLTVGSSEPATIDLIVAPWPPPADAGDEDLFADDLQQRLRPETVQEYPERQRLSWRTTIRASGEGLGAVAEFAKRQFSPTDGWYLPSVPASLTRDQRSVLAAMLIGDRRDLAVELITRGSSIQKVLSDLEIEEGQRDALETRLSDLGAEIVESSGSLGAVAASLSEAESHMGGMGAPVLNPLPPRLEELARSVSVDLDVGSGALPMRLHGSGPRGVASLQVQRVLYDRRLGRDGKARRPHPVTLVEEPEAHLHPQAQFELPALLQALPGQVVVTTHSSHLVTVVEPTSIRLLRHDSGTVSVTDLGPVDVEDAATPRALRPGLHREEMEKMKRLIERPFGELLFASAVVIGDGATERALLPPLLRSALGVKAHGVCIVDPGSMSHDLAGIVVKFARTVGIPWYLFADSDGDGKSAVKAILTVAEKEADRVIWVTGAGGGHAVETMMLEFDESVCASACEVTRPGSVRNGDTMGAMTDLKGSIGPALARALIDAYPNHTDWPDPLRTLVERVDSGR